MTSLSPRTRIQFNHDHDLARTTEEIIMKKEEQENDREASASVKANDSPAHQSNKRLSSNSQEHSPQARSRLPIYSECCIPSIPVHDVKKYYSGRNHDMINKDSSRVDSSFQGSLNRNSSPELRPPTNKSIVEMPSTKKQSDDRYGIPDNNVHNEIRGFYSKHAISTNRPQKTKNLVQKKANFIAGQKTSPKESYEFINKRGYAHIVRRMDELNNREH